MKGDDSGDIRRSGRTWSHVDWFTRVHFAELHENEFKN